MDALAMQTQSIDQAKIFQSIIGNSLNNTLMNATGIKTIEQT